MIKELNVKLFKDKVLVKRETCMVEFYSTICPLCVNFGPVYEEIANEMEPKIKFYKVDVNKEQELTKLMEFEGVPTMFLFYNGDYHEVPYPYDNPHEKTGYYKKDIINFINKKVI